MIKKTITCTDFDGNEYTEDYYFHLSKSEIAEMNLEKVGGLYGYAKRLALEDTDENREKLMQLYKKLILKSYGRKSADGRRFEKDDKWTKEFSETNAFDTLYIELLSGDNAFLDFCKGITPADVANKMNDQTVIAEANKLLNK